MDLDKIQTHGLSAHSRSAWLRWLIVGAALIAVHGASAAYYAHRYAAGRVGAAAGPLSLDMSFDDWAAATMGADSSAYLRTAENVAAGNGVVIQVPGASPPRIEPFFYWGPGAPLALGGWLRLVGGETMFTFFLFAGLVQLFFGAMAVATVNLYTRNTWALVLTALATGCCPPLQEWFYGVNLTSSEIVALIPLSLMMFALAKGLFAFRSVPAGTWRAVISWRVWGWFGLVSLLIGLHSLVRDSAAVFAAFLACFLVSRAILADRRRCLLALSTAAILLIGVFIVRQPIKMWNKQRIGISTVCTSSEGCIWRYGLWLPHDQVAWFQSSGIGFGQYLDADAALRVESYFKSGQANPELYSLGQLAQAIANRPGDAIAFKVERLPVLWLGTDRWPNVQWRLTHFWCLGFYLMLVALIVMRMCRHLYVPEMLYLYLALIFCASPLIHFEFRYTFPIWNTLVLVPGLLVATLARDWRGEVAESIDPAKT
jgi:hypothetical protein